MKKLFTIMAILGLMSSLFSADVTYPNISLKGRVLMEMVNENNLDFTDFDENTATGNDLKSYGHGRVDLKFKAELNQNLLAFVNTRFEGKSTGGDKWMNWGSDGSGTGDQLEDAVPVLQEAYVKFDEIFGIPVCLNMGRVDQSYGNQNIIYKKLDGLKLGYEQEKFFVNFHYAITENGDYFETAEGSSSKYVMGFYGGLTKLADMLNADLYLLASAKSAIDAEDETKTVGDAKVVFGTRLSADLMEEMITPYLEVAVMGGNNGQKEEYKYSGMLFDIGADFATELNGMPIDAMLEFFMASGNDADSDDEDETFGLGIADREEGYNVIQIAKYAYQMIKFGAGICPIEKLRTGFTFWMFNDNTKNYETPSGEKVSGENIYNELALNLDYSVTDNALIYLGMSYMMPNKDYYYYDSENGMYYKSGEDAGTAIYFGTEISW